MKISAILSIVAATKVSDKNKLKLLDEQLRFLDMLAHKRFLTSFLGTKLSVRRFGELTRFFNFYNFTWEIMVTISLLLML